MSFRMETQELENDIEDLDTANRSMVDALNAMKDDLAPLLRSTRGTTADAWNEVQRNLDNQIHALNSSHSQGVNVLREIRETMLLADRNGGNQVHGG
ncbi:WXG100 family type VII secretion target [Streptomyces catenulae]|uniref:WXG100 family type VII secretion target n=1 Tax=Streptomyces catenulae TaxID=66875 RepID=A0ABV2Z696_9ACTN|nr:hypothetical protein [Streptomyces catenulae]